jgi:hypothetical protein
MWNLTSTLPYVLMASTETTLRLLLLSYDHTLCFSALPTVNLCTVQEGK